MVRLDAVALDEVAVGRVPLAERDHQPAAVAEAVQPVDAALAERGVSDDLGAPVVLKRADYDLGRARAAAIGEYHHRDVRELPAAARVVVGSVAAAIHLVQDEAAVFEEQAHDFYDARQQPAGVVPNVEDEPLRSAGPLLPDRVRQLLRRVGVERRQPYVRESVAGTAASQHALQRDAVAPHHHLFFFDVADVPYQQRNFRAARPAYLVDRFQDAQSNDALAVHGQDQVAAPQSRGLGGAARDGRYDVQLAVRVHLHVGADAFEGAVQVLVLYLERFGRYVVGVLIAQRGDDAAYRALVELLRLQAAAVHVQLADQLPHLPGGAQVLRHGVRYVYGRGRDGGWKRHRIGRDVRLVGLWRLGSVRASGASRRLGLLRGLAGGLTGSLVGPLRRRSCLDCRRRGLRRVGRRLGLFAARRDRQDNGGQQPDQGGGERAEFLCRRGFGS